jgi:hypothetical protein
MSDKSFDFDKSNQIDTKIDASENDCEKSTIFFELSKKATKVYDHTEEDDGGKDMEQMFDEV